MLCGRVFPYYFLRPEQLLEVRKRRTHPLTNRIGIFALKRLTSAKKASMRSSIGSPAKLTRAMVRRGL